MKSLVFSFFLALFILFGVEGAFFIFGPASKEEILLKNENWRVASSPQLILKHNRGQGLGDDKSWLPLGSLPENKTLFCRESGDWIVFQSDEKGFRNPEKKWREQYDYIVVGDSFAQGACVSEESSWAGQIRAQGKSVLNIASYASGPLSQLITLREALKYTQVKEILWFYVPNDLVEDLSMEWQQPLFKKYYKQQASDPGMQKKDKRLYSLFSDFLNSMAQLPSQLRGETPSSQSFWKMDRLRKQISKMKREQIQKASIPYLDFSIENPMLDSIYMELLGEVRKLANEKALKITFVMVPLALNFYSDVSKDKVRSHYEKWQTSFKDMGFSAIDLDQFLRASESQPLDLYTHIGLQFGHFHKQGYERTGQYLIQNLIK